MFRAFQIRPSSVVAWTNTAACGCGDRCLSLPPQGRWGPLPGRKIPDICPFHRKTCNGRTRTPALWAEVAHTIIKSMPLMKFMYNVLVSYASPNIRAVAGLSLSMGRIRRREMRRAVFSSGITLHGRAGILVDGKPQAVEGHLGFARLGSEAEHNPPDPRQAPGVHGLHQVGRAGVGPGAGLGPVGDDAPLFSPLGNRQIFFWLENKLLCLGKADFHAFTAHSRSSAYLPTWA